LIGEGMSIPPDREILLKLVQVEYELLKGLQELSKQLTTLVFALSLKGLLTPEELSSAEREWGAGLEVEKALNREVGQAFQGLRQIEEELRELGRALRSRLEEAG